MHVTQLAEVIERSFQGILAEDMPADWTFAYPGGGGRRRWREQFLNCGRHALDAGQACRRDGISGAALEHALAVAIFTGFWEPTSEWHPNQPPASFDALPGESFREVFLILARAVIGWARAQRQAERVAA